MVDQHTTQYEAGNKQEPESRPMASPKSFHQAANMNYLFDISNLRVQVEDHQGHRGPPSDLRRG